MADYVKIYHFMWVDPREPDAAKPPDRVEHHIDLWKKDHPDWTTMFWNLNQCKRLFKQDAELSKLYDCVFETPFYSKWQAGMEYDVYQRMAMADICRLAVVYVYGGVYLDLGVGPISGSGGFDAAWNDYPQRSVLYCREPEEHYGDWGQLCLNSVIAARHPKSKFWLDFMHYICEKKSEPTSLLSKKDPINTTGPLVLESFATRPGTNANDAPLSSKAFARQVSKRHGGGLSEAALDPSNTTKSYAEKLWHKTSGWGRKWRLYSKQKIAAITVGCILGALAVAGLVALIVVLVKRRRRQ
jgi:hypothetical protein